MEQINNLTTGCFVAKEEAVRLDEDEDSDGEGGDDIAWMGYSDVADVNGGKSFVQGERAKLVKGDLVDLETGRLQKVRGLFLLPHQWFQMTLLRTKLSKDKYREPNDMYSQCYKLRDDPRRFRDNVVQLFLSKLSEMYDHADSFVQPRADFETYLKQRGQYDDLDLFNLEERLTAFSDDFPKEDDEEKENMGTQFKRLIVESLDFKQVRVGVQYPELLRYLPQLFPFQFKFLLGVKPHQLKLLAETIDEEPGVLAFKPMMSKHCSILGCETSSEALYKSGLMAKIPQHEQDAILIYEYIKKETKENGHTCVHFNKILDVLTGIVQQFEEALDHLNFHKATKTQMEAGYRVVYLMSLWKAESKIAKGLNSLVLLQEKQPWKLEVDWECDDFDTIRDDADQIRAARQIAAQPVVAVSGKGGCGKTYVVTKVITAARVVRFSPKKQPSYAAQGDLSNLHGDDLHDKTTTTTTEEEAETQAPLGDEEDLFSTSVTQMEEEEEDKSPDMINLLLTAPTGKAANLLGKRAGKPSFTLHQVIFSHRMMAKGSDWKHKDVNILVVDECSLVSVSTFSYLIELLKDHAQLRRVVLLGDIRQLPSIEPGNFLEDTFKSLARIGCGIELTTNHRAESQAIVNNATRISKKMYPVFDNDRFMLRRLPESNPGQMGNDYLSQDINVEVMKVMEHPALKSDVNSQFISFTRKVCESINDHCCKKYSDHRTKEHNKYVFRTQDKICCTKNGYVNVYTDKHGIMSCIEDKDNKSMMDGEGSEGGGVDRTISIATQHDVTSSTLVPGNTAGNTSATGEPGDKKNENDKKAKQIRLCNGEIFFILDELEKSDEGGKYRTFLHLSDKDPQEEYEFWVDKKQLRKSCKIRHAWARTIHTFQGSETDHVVYILGRSKHQNWQHVYTAVTRGRKSVFILGQDSVLRQAIKRSEIKRQTSLRKQLIERFQKNKNLSLNTTQAQMNLSSISSSQTNPPITSQTNQPISNRLRPPLHQTTMSFAKEKMDGPIAEHVDTSLNNTQFVTGILSALASEHDDETQALIADDNDELFTSIRTNDNKETTEQTLSESEDMDSEECSQSLLIETEYVTKRQPVTNIPSRTNRLSLNKRSMKLVYAEDTGNKMDMITEKQPAEVNQASGSDTDQESDDSQSLLTPPSKPNHHSKQSSTNKSSSQSVIISSHTLKHSSSEPDSDDSQSLLTPPSRTHHKTKSSITSKLQTENLTEKQKSPSFVENNFYPETPADGKSLFRIRSGLSPLTPGFSTGFTPGTVGTGFTPGTADQQNTSSPVNDTVLTSQGFIRSTLSPLTPGYNHGFHIRTGLSPLTPGYNDSFLGSHRLNDSNLDSSYLKTKSSEGKSSIKTENTMKHVSELDEFIEPKSNESQWSEVDDSDFLNIDDSVLIQNYVLTQKQQTEIGLRNGNTPNFTSNVQQKFTALKGSLDLISPRVSIKDIEKLRRLSNQSNVSSASQWSEVDDDQYLTLDLDDITNMAGKVQGQKSNDDTNTTANNSLTRYRNSNTFKSPVTNISSEPDSPDIGSYDSPSSPSLLETPPRSRSQRASPGVKRHNSNCDIDQTPTKRMFKQEDASSFVSPVKRSLAKLTFK